MFVFRDLQEAGNVKGKDDDNNYMSTKGVTFTPSEIQNVWSLLRAQDC